MTVLSIRGPYQTGNGPTWDIKTDLDPAMLTTVGVEMYRRWIDFAMGRASLGGQTLMHPTGRYASSIRFKQTGVASVSIMSLATRENPEANILETGHKAIDLKTYFAQGKVISLVRGEQGHYGSAGYGAPRRNATAFNRRKNIWASIRSQGDSGYARVGMTGWVIPPMAAYSPAAHLVDLFNGGAFHAV